MKIIAIDKCPVIKSAFGILNWNSCAAYNLILAHKDTFEDKKAKEDIPTVLSLILNCKEL